MNCGTCKHSAKQFDGATFECRRYPPQLIPRTVGNVRGTVTRFPCVEAYMCCGEYKRDPGAGV